MISVDVRQFNVDQQQNLKDRFDSLSVEKYNLTHIIIFFIFVGTFICIIHYKASQTLLNNTLTLHPYPNPNPPVILLRSFRAPL